MNIKLPNVGRFVPTPVARKASVLALKASKHSPTILFGTGVVGVVGTVVLASRATLKVNEVLEHSAKDRANIDALVGRGTSEYTIDDAAGDLRFVKAKTAASIIKLYTPTVIVGTLSIACLTQSHRILLNRNNALVAAYATLEKGFERYRDRVRDEIGEKKERDLYQGVVETTLEVDGKKTKVRQVAGDLPSPYARFFDEMNINWQPDPEANRIFIDAQKEYLQGRLNRKTWVSLNEAYRCLGLPETVEGQQVGWVIGRAGAQHEKGGDPYVDFGLGDWPHASDYVNGREVGILLDFNVTTILDKI